MPAIDLVELFSSSVAPLQRPVGVNLVGVPLPTGSRHRLAKDSDDCPCFLVSHEMNETSPAPIRLENLTVTFGAHCSIASGAGPPESGVFTIIRCLRDKPYLASHFLRAMSPIASTLGNTPTNVDVQRAVNAIVELFRALTAPSPKTIQGLWAELFVIASARDAHVMAAAWHADPTERFDFAAGAQRLEVKSNSQRRRQHHFSLEQLSKPRGSEIVIASLFVERSSGGTSLQELFDDIRCRLWTDTTAVGRFDKNFYRSLGSGGAEWMEEGFDRELAEDSLAFFLGDSIAKVRNHDPELITEVRFRSDLESIGRISAEEMRDLGGLYAATVVMKTDRHLHV